MADRLDSLHEKDCGRRWMTSSRLQPDGKIGNTELLTGDGNILNKPMVRDFDASQSFLGHCSLRK